MQLLLERVACAPGRLSPCLKRFLFSEAHHKSSVEGVQLWTAGGGQFRRSGFAQRRQELSAHCGDCVGGEGYT